MDAMSQLLNKRANLLKQIAESAKQGKANEVMAANDMLIRIESLIGRHKKLLQDISELNSQNRKVQPLQGTPQLDSGFIKDMMIKKQGDEGSGRGIGKEIRIDFLKEVSREGIHLEHIKGSIYETDSGHKVGIAVATERKADRWFLGLPIEDFDHAVLLCKHHTGETAVICIPKSFFNEYGDKMSHSGGQMKFNINRRGSGYTMLVPGTAGINVTKFLRNYSMLK